jgi:hypothetical protein
MSNYFLSCDFEMMERTNTVTKMIMIFIYYCVLIAMKTESSLRIRVNKKLGNRTSEVLMMTATCD